MHGPDESKVIKKIALYGLKLNYIIIKITV